MADEQAAAIMAARAALEGARAVHARCPSMDNYLKVQRAQDAMNTRLELWSAARSS